MQTDSEITAPPEPAQTVPDNLEDFTSLTEDRGVLKKIIKEGIKDSYPVDGDTVFVHYVGTYHGGDQHGQKFDSSRDRNERFKFNVGKSEVIKAWDLVIPTMKLGEVCELVALPDYAYKDGKTLKFEIELLEFYGEDISREQDGTARMSVLSKGPQVFCPEAGATVELHLKGCHDGKVFDERDVSYCVGDYSEAGVPRGVDSAVRKMRAEGRSIVRVSKQNSLGEEQCAKFGIPPGSSLEYEVTLKSFEKVKSIQTLSSFSEQIEHAQKIKNRANEYLKAGKHTLAQDMYNKLLSELLYIVTDGVKEKQILDQEMIAIHLNLALSYLRENNPAGVIENCDKVLDFNASNEKALFRKGEAFLLRGDVEQALQLFKRVQKAHPENTAAAAKVRVCENTLKKVSEQEKKMFRSAFMRLQKTGFGSSEETPKTEAPTAEAPTAEAPPAEA